MSFVKKEDLIINLLNKQLNSKLMNLETNGKEFFDIIEYCKLITNQCIINENAITVDNICTLNSQDEIIREDHKNLFQSRRFSKNKFAKCTTPLKIEKRSVSKDKNKKLDISNNLNKLNINTLINKLKESDTTTRNNLNDYIYNNEYLHTDDTHTNIKDGQIYKKEMKISQTLKRLNVDKSIKKL